MNDADGANAAWYVIDAQDQLIDVCPEWDAVALAGGGAARALRGGVVGRPLRQFIAGDATRMFLEAAVQASRLTGRTRRLPYRCDTPDEVRRMEMAVVPLAHGEVRIEHRLVEVRPRRGRLDVVPAPPGSSPRLWRCSMCLRLRHGGDDEWSASEALPPARIEVHYTVCPPCARMA